MHSGTYEDLMKIIKITLTPSGTDGTNTIDHYLYAIDNGAYQTSNVFSNLTEQTEYTVSIKAIDSDNRESNPYTIQITTDTYEIPVITNVSTSSTENSITINVSANNGDGTITRYLYSRDNGSNWYESTSSSYTFDNLTSNTTFYIQVKVEDENGRESVVYNTTETTLYINPVVNDVSVSSTYNSITANVSATAGTGNIRTYYYSINNGSYTSSTSNGYTFNNLNPGTSYTIRVYVVDSAGMSSSVYSRTISTSSYTNPRINSVSTEVISDAIGVEVTATDGTNPIDEYCYSINGGSYNCRSYDYYTFSGLSENVTYSIRIYAVDIEGYESNVYTLSATTRYIALSIGNAYCYADGAPTSIPIRINSVTRGEADIDRIYCVNELGDNTSDEPETRSVTYENWLDGDRITFYHLWSASGYCYVVDVNGVSSNRDTFECYGSTNQSKIS